MAHNGHTVDTVKTKTNTRDAMFFDSMADLRDWVRDTKPTKTGHRSSEEGKDEWSGNVTLDESIQMATDGWEEPRDDVNSIAAGIAADAFRETESQRPKFQFDVAGGTIDMGRMLSGEPECMLDFRMQPGMGNDRVVTLLVGICCSARVNPETLMKRGAAVVALIDILAATGRSVEVYLEATTQVTEGGDYRGKTRNMTCVSRVKAPEQPMDLDQLMFAIAHPGSFRKLVFAQWERMPQADDLGMGYGMPMKVQAREAVEATVVLDNPNSNDPEEVTDPVGWIVKILEQVAHAEQVRTNEDVGFAAD